MLMAFESLAVLLLSREQKKGKRKKKNVCHAGKEKDYAGGYKETIGIV